MWIDYFVKKADDNFGGFRFENIFLFFFGVLLCGLMGLLTMVLYGIAGWVMLFIGKKNEH